MDAFWTYFHRRGPIQLQQILRVCLSFQATEPRDKTFALQGITDAASNKLLPIDYYITVPEVLLNTARYFLLRSEILAVLHLAGIGWKSNINDMASWAVDWTRSQSLISIAFSSTEDKQPVYKTALSLPALILPGLDKDSILMRGIFVNAVADLSSLPNCESRSPDLTNISDTNYAWIIFLRYAWKMARESAPDPYHTGQTLSEAFWRTLICDHGSKKHPAPKVVWAQYFKDYRKELFKRHLQDSPRSTSISSSTDVEQDKLLLDSGKAFFEGEGRG